MPHYETENTQKTEHNCQCTPTKRELTLKSWSTLASSCVFTDRRHHISVLGLFSAAPQQTKGGTEARAWGGGVRY